MAYAQEAAGASRPSRMQGNVDRLQNLIARIHVVTERMRQHRHTLYGPPPAPPGSITSTSPLTSIPASNIDDLIGGLDNAITELQDVMHSLD